MPNLDLSAPAGRAGTRVLVVQNHIGAPAGFLGEALAGAGADLTILRPAAAGELPGELDGFHGLVVLGGRQSALDDRASPWLPDLLDLIRHAYEARRPVLGICLGAQIVARAFGGQVRRADTPEIGFGPIETARGAEDDPLFGDLGTGRHVMQWHYDGFELPAGAELVVTNGICRNQAFRLGRAVYGLQFHAEVTRDVVGAWIGSIRGEPPRPVRALAGSLDAEFAAHGAGARELAGRIAHRWLDLCAAGRGSRPASGDT
ncbi:MAG TPA: type 1 glutamine amidotransferase [Arenibaculum sp.]|nr:type 1 glutamine amidotransferase [Arenibaculum sp.]